MSVRMMMQGRKPAGSDATTPVPGIALTAWWDFSDEGSVTISTGISSVTDKSGNGNTLSQATAANQPAHNTNASIGGGILKAAIFDGTNDLLSAGAAVVDEPFTMLMVCQKPDNTGTDVLVDVQSRATYVGAASTGLAYWKGSAQQVLTQTSTDWTNQHIYAWQVQATSFSFWIDGSAKASSVAKTNDTGTNFWLGNDASNNAGNWKIGEVLIANSILTAADLNALAQYLDAKWGPTWTNI